MLLPLFWRFYGDSPTDPLVARKWRDVLPFQKSFWIGSESFLQICRQWMRHTAGNLLGHIHIIQKPRIAASLSSYSFLKDPRYQMPVNFGAIFLIARQAFSKELFFIKQSPNKTKRHENGWYKSPIGAECQGHADDIEYRARIHRVAYKGIRPGGNHLLVADNFNGRRGKRIFLEDSYDRPLRKAIAAPATSRSGGQARER